MGIDWLQNYGHQMRKNRRNLINDKDRQRVIYKTTWLVDLVHFPCSPLFQAIAAPADSKHPTKHHFARKPLHCIKV
jgi:hypothetical protein